MILHKKDKLFLVLISLFLTNALTSEITGSKLFSLEQSLGFNDLHLNILGIEGLSFTLTAGVISWPLIFTITDVINDYYGIKAIKLVSYITVFMISFMFLLIFVAIHVAPSSFWLISNQTKGIPNMQYAYETVLGQGLNIIMASIIAFLVGQIFDAYVFRKIKLITGDRLIWLRALISTLISQLIDTVIVLLIAFHIMQKIPLKIVTAWMITVYIYKFIAAFIFLPLVYVTHFFIEKYLGKENAIQMRLKALNTKHLE